MSTPAPSSASPPPTPASRLAARMSFIAAFTCFAINCVGNRLLYQSPNHGRMWELVLGSVTLGCLLAGVVLGAVGIAGGIRAKCRDTVLIALMGMTLNLGVVAVMIFILVVLAR